MTERYSGPLRILVACAAAVAAVGLTPPAQAGQGDLRHVTARDLEKTAVDIKPDAPAEALNRVPHRVKSPDGTRIATVQRLSTGLESTRYRISVAGPGRRRLRIADVVNYAGLTWSPDGTKVAFSEGALVHVADHDGRTRQVIYQGPGGPYPGACFDLQWSNSGRTLSFIQVENRDQLDLSRPVRVVITLGARKPGAGHQE